MGDGKRKKEGKIQKLRSSMERVKSATLNRTVRVDLIQKVTFEQRLEEVRKLLCRCLGHWFAT